MRAISVVASIAVVRSRRLVIMAYRDPRQRVVTLKASRQRLSPHTQCTSKHAALLSAEGESTPRCPSPRVIYWRAGLRFCSTRFTSDQWWRWSGMQVACWRASVVQPSSAIESQILEPTQDARMGGECDGPFMQRGGACGRCVCSGVAGGQEDRRGRGGDDVQSSPDWYRGGRA